MGGSGERHVDPNYEDYTVAEVIGIDDNRQTLKITKPLKPEGVYELVTVPVKQGVEPEEGDDLRLYDDPEVGIRGVDVNGENLFYLSREEKRKKDERRVMESKEEKKKEFEEKKEELDEKYEALPEPFQKRVDRFRNNNPEFRWMYEEYELFVCREAVKIAETLETPEAVKEFQEMSIEDQYGAVDLEKGHSSNTFGMAVNLAYLYLAESEKVPEMIGALSPLVGSEEYGGVPKE